jgi:hypothetical protein
MKPGDISDFLPAEDWLRDACEVLGLQRTVKIVAVRDRWIWTLDYEQDPNYPDFAMNMMKLEAALQYSTKRPIDLRLERLADKNMREKRNTLSGRGGLALGSAQSRN